MSEITNEELGRRRFQIQKEKAVELAVEKIRRGKHPQWESLSPKDLQILKDILGDIWTITDRTRWESITFSKLSPQNIESLIDIGKKIENNYCTAETAAKFLEDISNDKI